MRNWLRNTEYGQLLSNSIVTFALRISAAACVYLIFVLLARSMQPMPLGHFVIVQAGLWLTSSFASLGLASGANRFISVALGRGDADQVSAYISWSRKVVAASAVVCGVLAAALVFAIDRDLSSPYSPLILIAAASVPFVTQNTLNSQIARSLDWIFFASLTNVFLRPFLLLIGLATLSLIMGVVPDAKLALQIQLVLLIVLVLAQSAVLDKKLSRLGLPPPGPANGSLWVGTSIVLLLSEVYFAFYIDIHILVAGLFLQPQDLAILNAALRTISIMAFASAAVGIAFRPRIAQLFDKNDPEKLRAAARWALGLTVLPVLMFILLLIPFGGYVLELFGPEYVSGRTALIVAAFAQLAIAFATPLVPMLGMTGYHTELLRISLFTLLFVVVSHLVLTSAFGIVGSAMALLVSSMAWSLALYVRVVRNLGISLLHRNPTAN